MTDHAAAIVRANVRAILGIGADDKGIGALVNKGMANGNVQRVMDDATNFRISRLDELAKALGVQPWQLLVPGLKPGNLPELAADQRPGWPFDFEAARFDALRENERGMVEHAARVELERIEHERRRRAPMVDPAAAGSAAQVEADIKKVFEKPAMPPGGPKPKFPALPAEQAPAQQRATSPRPPSARSGAGPKAGAKGGR
jgi:hypothetical protein